MCQFVNVPQLPYQRRYCCRAFLAKIAKVVNPCVVYAFENHATPNLISQIKVAVVVVVHLAASVAFD